LKGDAVANSTRSVAGPFAKASEAKVVADRMNAEKGFDTTWYHVANSHGFWVWHADPRVVDPTPSCTINPEVLAYVTRKGN
jgi:hypothetical protein